MSNLFDTGHVAQLHEIQKTRLRRGEPGIGPEVEELIVRLTSGGVAGKMTDPRERLAKFLWDRGFGRDPAVDAKDFKDYLAGIPQIPAGLIGGDPDLKFLSLADPRPGLTRVCTLLGVQHKEFGYSDESSEPFDGRFVLPSGPFWFRHDDGRKNRKRRPDHCRDESTSDIMAGTAMEGLFTYAHHSHIVVEGEHVIDLPGTEHRSDRACCACLKVWGGRSLLHLRRDSDIAYPNYGSLRVRRK